FSVWCGQSAIPSRESARCISERARSSQEMKTSDTRRLLAGHGLDDAGRGLARPVQLAPLADEPASPIPMLAATRREELDLFPGSLVPFHLAEVEDLEVARRGGDARLQQLEQDLVITDIFGDWSGVSTHGKRSGYGQNRLASSLLLQDAARPYGSHGCGS